MNNSLKDAIKDIAQIVQFENWLRFYFIREEDDGRLLLEVPEEAQEKIKADYPDLAGLVEIVNHTAVTYESSTQAVCQFVASSLDGRKYVPGIANKVFDDRRFKSEMNYFGLWVQSHEEQLDQGFADFATWSELFEEWKTSDKVKEYIDKLQANTATISEGSGSIH